MNKKLNAFTLAETLIVLVLIGTISVLTIANSARMDKVDEKKIAAVSKKFYSASEAIYQQVLFRHCKDATITKLKPINEGEIGSSSSSEILRDLFVKYNDGEKISCPAMNSDLADNTSCARFQTDIIAGFNLNGTCDKSFNSVYEYSGKGKGSATKSCGYIIYGIKKLNGTLGKDLFIIPLGKGGFKRVYI